ncbi:MAG: hypothetical protein AAGA43_16000 [Bacteroidota bacterium]
MKTSEKSLPERIIICSLLLSLVLVGHTLYDRYSEEIGQKVTKAIVDVMPDLDNAVAKL